MNEVKRLFVKQKSKVFFEGFKYLVYSCLDILQKRPLMIFFSQKYTNPLSPGLDPCASPQGIHLRQNKILMRRADGEEEMFSEKFSNFIRSSEATFM